MTLFKTRNFLLLLALLLAGFLAAIVLIRYRSPVKLAEVANVLPSGVDLALQDINYTHTEGGVARWRLVAKQVEHRALEKVTALRDLQVTFYDVKGAEQGALKAHTGQVNADYSVVEVRGEVEVVSSGYTLQTDYLTYRQQDRSIRTDAPVRLVSAGLTLDGVGMDLDLDTKRLQIPARVHAIVYPDRMKKGSS
ncbi:MAG: LPS export ABC transporter periplasmic protein LptC [Desulfuromonadales bacterium]|nr:LPS export ABC transporter periplasmic protein LptC [Desulfuromonadales bacterium]